MPPSPTRRLHGRLVRVLRRTRAELALKTAVASSLSFLLALQLPDPARDYAYYAPLGAVVTTLPTMVQSAREAARAVGAIGLGAVLALVGQHLLGRSVLTVGLVVGVAVLVASLRVLGDQRSYVAIAGLFVLVIGQDHALSYAGAYAGLFLLGAVVTVVVHTVAPSFPVHEADEELVRVRAVVARHLEYLADRVVDPGRPTDGSALSRSGPDRPPLTEVMPRAQATVLQLADSVQGNARARGARERVRLQVDTWRALERAALLVEDLYGLADDEPWGLQLLSVSPALREPMARAVRALARTTTSSGLLDTVAGARGESDEAVRSLTSALREHERSGGDEAEALVVATIITTLRRTISALTPHDRIELAREPLPAPARPDRRPGGGDGAGDGPRAA